MTSRQVKIHIEIIKRLDAYQRPRESKSRVIGRLLDVADDLVRLVPRLEATITEAEAERLDRVLREFEAAQLRQAPRTGKKGRTKC